MQRKKTFLVVCISILTSPLWAQVAPPGVLINSGLKVVPGGLKVVPSGLKVVPRRDTVSFLHPVLLRPAVGPELRDYGSGYYMGSLGFFCKEEIQMEKTIHLPLRLRLGSLQEVNRLEGKPGW
jgi:hypothetical protein